MRRLWRNSAKTRSRWSCISKTCRINVAVTIACSWEGKSSISSFARILQEVARNWQQDKNKWEIQKDNDLFDISRDSCFDVFSWVFKASLWPIFPDISIGRTFIHVLHQAMLHLLKQVMFRFLKQNEIQGKTVSELLKLDSKKGGTPIERW